MNLRETAPARTSESGALRTALKRSGRLRRAGVLKGTRESSGECGKEPLGDDSAPGVPRPATKGIASLGAMGLASVRKWEARVTGDERGDV